MHNNRVRHIRVTLYNLKRQFGFKSTHYREAASVTDLQTGVKSRTVTVSEINNLILLPQMTAEKFQYDLSFIAANKNFTYGGNFEVGDRFAIIEGSDLSVVPDHNTDYIVFDGKRYNIVTVVELDYQMGYVLSIRRTQGQSPEQIVSRTIRHTLGVDHATTLA